MTREIYYNGAIITMEDDLIVEAIMVEDGIIKAMGDEKSILALETPETTMVDLAQCTMLPAFIDSHSHITGFAQTLNNVSLGDAENFQAIVAKMVAFLEVQPLQPNQWLIGFGYDHNFLAEQAHPDRLLLDQIATDHPICITHMSGHIAVVNSKALAMMGIDATTKAPNGGVIGRMPNSQEPNGYLEENGFFNYAHHITKPSLAMQCLAMDKAQQIYLQYGIATVQEGSMGLEQWQLLNEMAQAQRLRMDVVGYLDLLQKKMLLKKSQPYLNGYFNHFKVGGYKIFLDGSPQGRTAWMTQPYLPVTDQYVGYPIYKNHEVEQLVEMAFDDNRQILAHCNGDAAAAQFIHGVETVQEEQDYGGDIRPVMIHAQLVRRDQLQQMKELDIMPSFFVAHTYYWGDIHRQNFGDQRAMAISPVADAIALDMPFTFHQDTPVILPNMFESIWCAVNRLSKSGVVIGEDQRISVLEALKAVTCHAAYQYFEEREKGSIAVGKRADLIIVDQNPLTIAVEALKDIVVLKTIKDGTVVFSQVD